MLLPGSLLPVCWVGEGAFAPGCFGGISEPPERSAGLPLPRNVPVSIPPASAGVNCFGDEGLTLVDFANMSHGVVFRGPSSFNSGETTTPLFASSANNRFSSFVGIFNHPRIDNSGRVARQLWDHQHRPIWAPRPVVRVYPRASCESAEREQRVSWGPRFGSPRREFRRADHTDPTPDVSTRFYHRRSA